MKDRTRHQRRCSKSISKVQKPRPGAKDYHHFLFQKKHWTGMWAKRLREHPYCGAKIPMLTLHKELHQKIHDVPVPNEDVCEYVWHELEALRITKVINAERDHPEQKLFVLIELFSSYDSNLDATLATLKWQKAVIHKFYQAPH